MKYTNLGRSGLKVSRICLGMMTYGDPKWRPWVLTEEAGRPFVKRALEAGINFFDTADMYSLGVTRSRSSAAPFVISPSADRVVIATKAYYPMSDDPNDRGLSRKHLLSAVDGRSSGWAPTTSTSTRSIAGIRRRPSRRRCARSTTSSARARSRYIGASSMAAWQFAKALYLADRHGLTRFVSMQNHYNLVYREEEREMMPLCREEGIGVVPWSPLARGFLAGNRRSSDKGETARAQRTRSPTSSTTATPTFASSIASSRWPGRRV